MPGIPIRLTAAGGIVAPRPTASPPLAGWRPTPIARVAGGIPRLNPLRLNPVGIGLTLGAMVVEEVFDRALVWFSGLQKVSDCSFGSYDAYTYNLNTNCLNGVGALSGGNFSQLFSGPLATAGFYHILGAPYFTVVFRRRDVAIYKASTYVDYQGRRPKPWVQRDTRTNVAPYTTRAFPPGSVPSVVAPWPVWGRPIPWTPPAPTPTAPDTVTGVTPTTWTWTGTGTRPVVQTGSVVRAVPATGTREVKIGANSHAATLFFQLIRARELVSEVEDFWGVLYMSLPRNLRRAYGGDDVSNAQQLRALWDNWDRIDPVDFLQNLLANQIEDEIIGRTWINYRSQLRDIMYSGSIGSTGNVGNPSFQSYARSVSDLAKHVAQGMRNEFQDHGWERRYRELLGRAEQAFQRLLQSQPNQRRNP